MASRWKRFAFFEKHSLSLNHDIVEDLLPVRSQETAAGGTEDVTFSMVSTMAALPWKEQQQSIVVDPAVSSSLSSPTTEDEDPLQAMWISLSACSPASPRGTQISRRTNETTRSSIRLASQAQQKSGNLASTPVPDGLVLLFVTSSQTHMVHCVDITRRCHPSNTTTTTTGPDSATVVETDGWRGYFAPFPTTTTDPSSLNQENASSSTSSSSTTRSRIIALAVCRGSLGHRPLYLACCSTAQLVIWEDPHLFLSCRRPVSNTYTTTSTTTTTNTPTTFMLESVFPGAECTCVDIAPGLVAVGSTQGAVHLYLFSITRPGLRLYLKIPPPPGGGSSAAAVSSVKIAMMEDSVHVFVSYAEAEGVSTGLVCYEMPTPDTSSTTLTAPSARHDLDGRPVSLRTPVDGYSLPSSGMKLTVARSDGLYSYSRTEKESVAPVDGSKSAMCLIPPATAAQMVREVDTEQIGYGYALVASKDTKAQRDSIDIYDATNKIVALHMLLSPGQRAVGVASINTPPSMSHDGSYRDGVSSAMVLTSGGSLITLTEKTTQEKVTLLLQKALYTAAIVVAYSDPSYEESSIVSLYRQYAEYLYRKGDFASSMDQYINTIGSLESSHIIFRFLDAPKIPLLVKYLETLRERNLASPTHNELLRTCYLKLNNTEAADSISTASAIIQKSSVASMLTDLASNPKDALASICSLPAPQVVEIFTMHGTALVRAFPKESAGIVISLCMGTYSPEKLAGAALLNASEVHTLGEYASEDKRACNPYSISLFAPSFIEHPKTLRMILSHCNRNKCPISPTLRRTLLELTLKEWNHAKKLGDVETEKNRRKEAIASLTDSHCREVGDYDALVIVQLAGFEEGEMILYERLQMTPMLLERYAKEGTEKARRQMLALSQTDPDTLAEVLAHLVKLKSDTKADNPIGNTAESSEDDSLADEVEEILDDIKEALDLAQRQKMLSPIRVVRILSGEESGQFSMSERKDEVATIPLSVALDYVSHTLESSRQDIDRLQSEVEEFTQLCSSIESEIESLLRAANDNVLPPQNDSGTAGINIDDIYSRVLADGDKLNQGVDDQIKEAFWRDLSLTDEPFEVIARFLAKGVIQ